MPAESLIIQVFTFNNYMYNRLYHYLINLLFQDLNFPL